MTEYTDWSARELRMSDAESVLEAFTASEDMARQGNVTTIEEARQYVTYLTGKDARATVAAQSGSDRILALAGATIDTTNRNAWVFYWAHPEARGRGITSQLVTDFCNDLLDVGLHRLELGYRTNNPGSGKVARAAGFIKEGLEREKFDVGGTRVDVVTCGRLATDPWPGKNSSN